MDNLAEILSNVEAEVRYQADIMGGGDVDGLLAFDLEHNAPHDFVAYVARYATKWDDGSVDAYSNEELQAFRSCMVKVAAVAVSAVRWADYALRD